MFQIGDIVMYRNLAHVYYMITDIADYSAEGDEIPDVECEVVRIYPVSSNCIFEIFKEEDLILYAVEQDKEYDMILDFVRKQREQAGIFEEPEYFSRIRHTKSNTYQNEVNKDSNNYKVKFSERDIKRILEDDVTDKQVEAYLEKLDTHLHLLNIAIKNNSTNEIEFQTSQLKKVRQVLMELEYFSIK